MVPRHTGDVGRMPKKREKDVLKLPRIPGALGSVSVKGGISDVSTSTGGRAFTSVGISDFTANGPSISVEDAVGLTQLLDSALELPNDLGITGGLGDDALAISSPAAILKNVKKIVRERNPHLEEVDDALLERRRKEDRAVPGCHVILPDSRVRRVDDQLNRHIRAALLGEDVTESVTPAPPRREEETKKEKVKRVRNPWYIHPKDWHSENAMRADDEDTIRNPYENLAKANSATDAASPEMRELLENSDDKEGGRPRRLTVHDKETLPIWDSYRRYVIREQARLPHFLT